MVTISLNLKKGTETKRIQIEETASISDLERLAAVTFDIKGGEIMFMHDRTMVKKDKTVKEANLKNDDSVYLMVKKSQEQSSPRSSTSQTNVKTPPPNSSSGISNQTNEIGSQSQSSIPDLSTAFQSLQNNPNQPLGNVNAYSDFLNNPATKDVMNKMLTNPELLKMLIQINPELRQLSENPQIRHLLEDPGFMRQVVELSSNPVAMQEFMRNHDQALRNIESIPGGLDMLSRVYSGLQPTNEPQTRPDPVQFTAEPNLQGTPLADQSPARTPAASSNGSGSSQQASSQPPAQTVIIPNIMRLNFSGADAAGGDRGRNIAQSALFWNRIMKPEVQKAMRDYQEALTVLQRELPSVFGHPPTTQATGSTSGFSTSDNNTTSSTPGTITSGPRTIPELEAMYPFELSQMLSMGFTDRDACLRALEKSDGDIDLAVSFLFEDH